MESYQFQFNSSLKPLIKSRSDFYGSNLHLIDNIDTGFAFFHQSEVSSGKFHQLEHLIETNSLLFHQLDENPQES